MPHDAYCWKRASYQAWPAAVVAAHAPHMRVPRARIAGVARVARRVCRARDGVARVVRLARHAAHDVDAEAEADGVDAIGQRLESVAARRRRIFAGRGQIAAVGVDGLAGFVPAIVDDDGVPAVRLQVRLHRLRLVDHLLLGDAGAERVVAVPAGGRRQREGVARHERVRGGRAARGAGDRHRDGIGPGGGHVARDDPGARRERQARGQPGRGERQRRLPGGRDREHERRRRPRPERERRLQPRRRRRRRHRDGDRRLGARSAAAQRDGDAQRHSSDRHPRA